MKKTALFIALLIGLSPGLLFAQLTISKKPFGTFNKKETYLYTISNGKMQVKVTDFGAILQSIIVPDKKSKPVDIVLGYSNVQGYLGDESAAKTFFGSIPARFANRIEKGQFKLDNKLYKLKTNEKGNTLHGGPLNCFIWSAKEIKGKNKAGISFQLTSKDGYWGFPGNLTVTVDYLLDDNNNLYIEYYAKTDKDTVVNLTNHCYFNLNGQGSTVNDGKITNQYLTINSNHITPTDSKLIPTGQVTNTKNTPFDFSKAKLIGKDINDTKNQQIQYENGYDVNFLLNSAINAYPKTSAPLMKDKLHVAAEVMSPVTGITMKLYSTQPGVQFYSGNFLPKDKALNGKDNGKYKFRSGFALETQHYPNAPNIKSFPSTKLSPGETYHQESIYNFSVKK